MSQIFNMLVILLFAAMYTIAQGNSNSFELELLYTLENEFIMPESAVVDSERGYVYVSNVNDYAADGNGFISRVKLDGSEVKRRWITGISSPTGLALFEEKLFFADFNVLVEADVVSGAVIKKYPAPDLSPALNDVAITADGEVFVSGSASNSIYKLEGEHLITWVHHDENLVFANGLYVDGNQLVQGGKNFNQFDLESKEFLSRSEFANAGQENIDGITSDGCGGYLITLVDDARLWRVLANGSARVISEFEYNGIDLHYAAGIVAMPRVKDSLSVYTLVGQCNP